jgi:hypothetical protein
MGSLISHRLSDDRTVLFFSNPHHKSQRKNMTVQIGTPDFLLDRAYLKILYKDLLVQMTDFLE